MRLPIRKTLKRSWLAALAVVGLGATALAAPVEITNASFEAPDLTTGGATWTNEVSGGWVNPGVEGDVFVEFIGGFADEAVQHIGTQNGAYIYQKTGVAAEPNTTYTLIVALGNRLNQSAEGGTAVLGLTVLDGDATLSEATANLQVAADEVLTATAVTLLPPATAGTFADGVLTFTTGAEVPAGSLTVFLGDDDTAGRSHFDNVRLYSQPAGTSISPEVEFQAAARAANSIVLDGDLSEWVANPIVNPQFRLGAEAGELAVFEPFGGGTYDGLDDQSSVTYLTYDEDNVYVGVVVTDDYHEHAAEGPAGAWNGDGIQIHVANAARDTQVSLRNFALQGIEGALGDVVVHFEAPGDDDGSDAAITRDGTTTTYEIMLPKAALGLDTLAPGVQLGIGMTINDGDEAEPGQKGWGGLGAHALVFGKTPSETALVTLGGSAGELLLDFGSAGPNAAGTDPGWIPVSNLVQDAPFSLGGGVTITALEDGFNPNISGAPGAAGDIGGRIVPQNVLDDYLFKIADTAGTSALMRVDGLAAGDYDITVFEGRTTDAGQVGTIWVGEEPADANTGDFAAGKSGTVSVTVAEGDAVFYRHLEDGSGGISGMIISGTPSMMPPAPAEAFYPIASVTTSTVDDLFPVSNLIQGPGVGFDAAAPYTKLISGADGNWVTAADAGFPSDYIVDVGMPVFVFDLGADVPLTEISSWGYDASNANGVTEFSLRFATDAEGATGFAQSIAYNPTFAVSNDDTDQRQSRDFAELVTARYVEFTATDTAYVEPGDGSTGGLAGGDRAGLGEIAFAIRDEVAPPGAELIACWDFQVGDPSEGTIDDVIGGNVGTIIGGASLTAPGEGASGAPGDFALDLSSGAGGLSVDGAFLNDVLEGDSVTVMFWQKLRNVTAQTTFKMFSPSSSGTERGWSVHSTWSDGNVYYDTAGCCDAGTMRISGPLALDNEWHHFTFVKDGENKQVFVDGELLFEGPGALPLPTDITLLTIGSNFDGAASTESMDGLLDEFRIFKGVPVIADWMGFKDIPDPGEVGPTVVDVALGDENFSTLVTAVSAAGLVETLSGPGPFTVFAPTNDAFAALPEGTLEALLADPSGQLTDILLYHVVPGSVLAADVVGLTSAPTVLGPEISIEVVDGAVILNGNVRVTATDIIASNGVVHVIDGVLLPPVVEPPVAGEELLSLNFDGFDDGVTDLGDGTVMAGTAMINGGRLQLTENDVAGGGASFSIPAIPNSSQGWIATFDLTIFDGEGANEPADGLSLNYGNAALGEIGSAEEGMAGAPSVTENISFEIDTWMNLDAEQGVNIAEKVGGVDTDLAFTNGPILLDGTTVSGQVVAVFDPSNGLSFSTTGLETNADFANVATSFVGNDDYTFILSARVGGANQTVWVDNLVISALGDPEGPGPIADGLLKLHYEFEEGEGTVVSNLAPTDGGGAPPAAVTGAFTDASELDFSGDIIYAVATRSPGGAVIGDATFTTSDETPGLAYVAQNEILNWGDLIDLGEGADNDALEEIINSIRWSAANDEPTGVTYDFDVAPGNYQVTLLFGEKCCDRGFDIALNGELIADNFSPNAEQLAAGGLGVSGAYVTYTGYVDGNTLSINLDGTNTEFPDKNAILSGVVIESLGGRAPGVLADSIADWAGTEEQGVNGWTYGYRGFEFDGPVDYDPADFTAFSADAGWTWTGTSWDWADGNVPWTTVAQEEGHPNTTAADANTTGTVLHHAIRRWTSDVEGDVLITYSGREVNLGGDGVVVGVHINGVLLESTQIAGGDAEGFSKTVSATLAVGDVVDCFLSPTNVDGAEVDGSDGSAFAMRIEAPPTGAPVGLVSTTNANVWRLGNESDDDTLSVGGPGYMFFDTANGADATYIDTGMTPADLGIEGTPYTMMARVRQDQLGAGDSADAMIFGQTSGEVLHNGARGDQLHIGHWGSDHTGGSVALGEWRHVAYVFDGADHLIYVDGTEVARSTSGDKVGLGTGTKSQENVLIGITRLDQDRDFVGGLDDVRIYCGELSQGQIEAIACASPRADCDGDGIPDSVELAVFGTLDRDGTGDFDGDRLNDATEYALGTAMDNRDTDGDQLWDSAEVWGFYSDPLGADSDNDGLNDSAEVAAGTDPTTDDTDRDGITDGDELANGPSTTTIDFESDPGLEIINFSDEGIAPEVRAEGGNPGGYFSLTDAVNGARASVIFPDTTGGSNIAGFKFGIDARIGGGTPDPADGLSISLVRPSDPLLAADSRGSGFAGTLDVGGTEEDLPEEGSQTGVSVGFDAWVSGDQDLIGFSVRVDGVLIDQIAAPVKNGDVTDPTSLQTGPRLGDDPAANLPALGWARFEIELDVDGTLDVTWKGSKLVENVQTNWVPSPAQLVFAARTGGANQAHHFDNLSLVTIPEGSADPLVFNEGAVENGLMVHYEFDDFDASAAAPLDIIFVSFHETDAPSAAAAAAEPPLTEAADKGYTDLLTAAGHNVTRWLTRPDATADDAAALNAADLIIISRSVSSGHYNNDANAEFWNTMITTPVMNLGGYTYRNSRLNWTDGGTMVDSNAPVTLAVAATDHPIFAGVDVAQPYANFIEGEQGVSFNNNTVIGGTVLATAADDGSPVANAPAIFEFEAGATVNNGQVLSGQRLAFLTGSRELGRTSETSGLYDLTATGEQMFLNAVTYLGGAAAGASDGTVVTNHGLGVDGTLVAPEGVTLRDVASTDLSTPTIAYTEVGQIPSMNGQFDGADLLDATFRVLIDFDAKTEGNAENIWETGGATIGSSFVYEAPSTLALRTVGNGGNDVLTTKVALSPADLDAGTHEVIWTIDTNDAGPEVASIWINGVLAASSSFEKGNDWSGGDAMNILSGTTSLAAGGGNTSLPGGSSAFASGTVDLDTGIQFFRDTLYENGVINFPGATGDAAVYVDTNHTAAETGAGTDNYTMFARLRPADLAGDNMVFGQATGNVLHNGFREANFHQGHWGNDITGGTAVVGNWYNVAWRYTAQQQTIFVNGEPVVTGAAKGLLGELGNVLVGATRLDQDRSFNGAVDSVRIYNRGLSHELIRDIHGTAEDVSSNLLVRYEFEDGISMTVRNLGNAGAPDGHLNSLDVIGAYSGGSPSLGGPGAMSFDTTGGTDATYIDTGLSGTEAGVNGAVNYTLMAWIKPTNDAAGDQMIFGQGEGNVLHNGIRDRRLHIGHWGNDTGSGVSPVSYGQWQHVAFTYDGAGLVQTIYHNGEVTESAGAKGPLVNDGNLLIGTTRFNEDRDYTGLLDDVRVYSGVLSSAQIVDIAGLVDSDGDGLLDPFERAFFGNLAMGGSGDIDGDGISNLDEQRLGLDPTVNDARFADSDGDGWTLGDETAFETNPENANSFPELFVGGGQWEVRTVQAEAAFTGLEAAIALLNGEAAAISDETTFHDFINFGTGAQGSVDGDEAFPGGATDNFVTLSTADIEVTETGDYTLSFSTDDGMRITVDGNVVAEVDAGRGAPAIDPYTVRLSRGRHSIELIQYEQTGGDAAEFAGTINTENSLNGLGGGTVVLIPAAGEEGPNDGPPEGLLAYWDFNGSGDPVDLAYGEVATLTGGAAYGEGMGGAGDGAIDFGMTSEGQTLVVDPAVIGPIADSDAFTVSFWQNLYTVANSSAFWADAAAEGDRAFQAHVTWGDGNVYFDTAGCCAAEQRISTAVAATPGTWQHFAFVKDGPFKAFYVDGVEILSGDGAAPIPAGFLNFSIGSANGGANSMQGLIDEFSIWSVALNPGEISDLAAGGVPYMPGGGPAASPLADGLIGYWPFDGDLEDKAGDSHGTGVGDPIEFADGQFGQGIDLNGANHVITPVENEEMFDFPEGNFSVSAWFRVDAFDKSWQALVTKGEGSNWRIHRRGDTDHLGPVGGPTADSATSGADMVDGPDVNDGAIHHVVLTNGPDGVAYYLDGVLAGEAPAGGTQGNEWPMMIGENADGGGNGRTWNGLIDEVAVWSRGLSADEVGLLYGGPSIGEQLAAAGGDVVVYSESFDYEDGLTDLGDGTVMAGAAVIDGGQLQLTQDGGEGGSSSFSIPAIPNSSNGWTATFDLTIFDSEGANEPADGFSLNYGNAALGELGSAEEGMAAVASVTENISFEIDTWMNLDAEQGVNIAEKVGGVDADLAFTNGPILLDGTTVSGQVVVTYDPANGVSFSTTGLETNADFANVATTFVGNDDYTFIFSGRVGGANQTVWIDNLVITTPGGGGGDGDDPRSGAVAQSSGPLTSPTLVNFGDLSGDASYEFSFNAVKEGPSTALAGNLDWALKLEQWNETGFFGTTEFGVADNLSDAPTVFGADTHAVLVSDTAAGSTLIYVNGALVGSVPGNPALTGEVTVMGATREAGPIDVFGAGSVMYGWATYNTALSADEVAALAAAPFAAGSLSLPFMESFDSVVLGPNVDEEVAGDNVWTAEPPAGWTVDNSGMAEGGVTEWRGWTFADPAWWASVDDQRRSEFTKASGAAAIADPDEWDDIGSPSSTGTFNSFLSSPAINVSGESNLTIAFDFSWRPEVNQVGNVTVSFDGGAAEEVFRLDTPTSTDDNTNSSASVPVAVPDGASSLVVTFGMFDAGNNWFWAIDNVSVDVAGPMPIAHWPLDEITDGVSPDVVGDRHMTAVNLTADDVVPGAAGNAIAFDNARMTLLEYVGEEGQATATSNPAYTVSLWTKIKGTGQNDLRIFSEGSTTSGTPLFNLGTANNGDDDSLDLYLRTVDNGNPYNHARTTGMPLDDTWHHIAFTQEEGGQIAVYIDGVLDGVDTTALLLEFGGGINTTSIGGIRRADPSHWVTGLIDDVKIFDVALTAEQVAAEAGVAAQINTVKQLVDTDRDGTADVHELMAGTDASDPSDYFHISGITPAEEGLMIKFDGVEGHAYEIEFSTDLSEGSWNVVGSQSADETAPVEFMHADRPAGQGFYRARIAQD